MGAVRTTLRVVAALVAVTVGVGLVSAPASAETRVTPDRRADAHPSMDIAWVKVRNRATRVRVTINVPRFEQRRLGGVTLFVGRKVAGRPEYAVSSIRRGSRWQTTFQELDVRRQRCAGLRVQRRAHGVIVSVPQRCLGGNRAAVRVQVAVFTRAYLHGDVPPGVIVDPQPGPTLPIDGLPSVQDARMTRWVPYR